MKILTLPSNYPNLHTNRDPILLHQKVTTAFKRDAMNNRRITKVILNGQLYGNF